MSSEHGIKITELDDQTRQAVRELQSVISSRYPTTTYELVQSPEDPAVLHLRAVADVEDPDEVGDSVVERVVSLQVEEGIPLHVIPLRTRERVEEARNATQRGGGKRSIELRNLEHVGRGIFIRSSSRDLRSGTNLRLTMMRTCQAALSELIDFTTKDLEGHGQMPQNS